MSGKRVIQIIVGVFVVVAALLVTRPLAWASDVAGASQQAADQDRLSERYGEAAQPYIAPEIMQLYETRERYGEAAQPVISPELMQLYETGERYGQAAQPVITPELMQLYEMGDRYGAP